MINSPYLWTQGWNYFIILKIAYLIFKSNVDLFSNQNKLFSKNVVEDIISC